MTNLLDMTPILHYSMQLPQSLTRISVYDIRSQICLDIYAILAIPSNVKHVLAK